MIRTIRRLTFVTDGPHFGGAERYIVSSAQSALGKGLNPHIWWIRLPLAAADVFESARSSGIPVMETATEDAGSLPRLARAFRRMLRNQRPDGLVINACGRPRLWMIPWLARWSDTPTVWVQQMIDATDHRRLPPALLGGRMEGLHLWRVPQALRHHLAGRAATAVVALNDDDRERIMRCHCVPRNRIRVVPHGVDVRQFRFDAHKRSAWRRQWGLGESGSNLSLVVGAAGRLSKEKGIDLLIEAGAILHQRNCPILIVIAGSGGECAALADLAEKLGIPDRVRFIDFVDDMPGFLSALDMFAMVSRTESFGLALAEAMSCERAVVATPTSGSRQQIEHRVTGWQLGGFDPHELADGLWALAGDAHLRTSMGRAARMNVQRCFSADLTLERTIAALTGPAGRRPVAHASAALTPLAADHLAGDVA